MGMCVNYKIYAPHLGSELLPNLQNIDCLFRQVQQRALKMSGGKASGSKQHERTAVDALRQDLPHLCDPDYLQDTSAGQQSEEKTDKDKVKHAEHQGKKKRKTVQAAQLQLPWLAADAFAAALGAIPANDWWRTWPADRTIMLRMTSKLVKSAADKLRPPAIVRVSRAFLDNVVCCKRERLLDILTEVEKLTSRYLITILDLRNCVMCDQDAGMLPGVLAQ